MIKWFKDYLVSPTHKWWVDNVWRPSWTKITTALYGIPAMLITAGEVVSRFANDTTISSYLAQIGVPNWVPGVIAGIALIHYVASGRDD